MNSKKIIYIFAFISFLLFHFSFILQQQNYKILKTMLTESMMKKILNAKRKKLLDVLIEEHLEKGIKTPV